MVTPKEFAVIHDVAYTTVMKWLQRDLIPGAVKEMLQPPFQGHIYWVPKDASRPESKPGPKKGSKRGSGLSRKETAEPMRTRNQ